jgi:hypothetical protein
MRVYMVANALRQGFDVSVDLDPSRDPQQFRVELARDLFLRGQDFAEPVSGADNNGQLWRLAYPSGGFSEFEVLHRDLDDRAARVAVLSFSHGNESDMWSVRVTANSCNISVPFKWTPIGVVRPWQPKGPPTLDPPARFDRGEVL